MSNDVTCGGCYGSASRMSTRNVPTHFRDRTLIQSMRAGHVLLFPMVFVLACYGLDT